MLASEFKKGFKCDLYWPLKKWINGNFGAEMAASHEDVLQELNRLREEARQVSGPTEAGRASLLQYYRMMSAAVGRLPFSEGQLRCDFTWTSLLNQSKDKRFEGSFELLSVLLNAGAVAMQQGAKEDLEDEQGVKRCCAAMQAAAGCFEAAQKHVVEKRSADDGLVGMLLAVSLAQAQECFVWQAEKSGKAARVVALLAWAACKQYEEAEKALGSFSKVWTQKLACRRSVMWAVAAVAEARCEDSDEDKQGLRHGSKIGWLQEALRRLDANCKQAAAQQSGLEKQVQHYTAAANQLLTKVTKENNSIYFKKVDPNPAAGASKLMVKPTPIETGGEDPFSRLIPHHVMARIKQYEERRTELFDQQQQLAEQLNATLRQTLTEMGLPGSLDAQEPGMPPELSRQIAAVSNAGGEGALRDLAAAKKLLAEEDTSILLSAVRVLDDEEREAQAAAAVIQVTPSRVLTLPLRQEIAKLQATFDAASKSDLLVDNKLAAASNDLRALPGIAQQLQQLRAQQNQQQSPFAQPLRQCLGALDALVAHRAQLLQRMREGARTDDISAKLIARSAAPAEEVFAAQLKAVYGEFVQQMEDNANRQRQQLEVTRDVNNAFSGASSGDAATAARQQLCQQCARACSVFLELQENFREGITFYTDAQQLCVRLKRQAEDFVMARREERQASLPMPTAPASYGMPAAAAPPPAFNHYGYNNNNNNNMYANNPAGVTPFNPYAAQPPRTGW